MRNLSIVFKWWRRWWTSRNEEVFLWTTRQGSQDETLIEVQRTCWLHGKALLRNPLESTGNPPRQVYAKGCRGILSNRGFVAPMEI